MWGIFKIIIGEKRRALIMAKKLKSLNPIIGTGYKTWWGWKYREFSRYITKNT